MGKLVKKCSTCKKRDLVKGTTDHVLDYNTSVSTDICGLLNKKLTDEFMTPFNEFICYNTLPRCAEKITELTLLLAKSVITGQEPYNEKEFKKLTANLNEGWPRNGELNINSGFHAIEDYIQSFKIHLKSNLKYSTNFILQNSDSLSSSYLYEVIWSIPTISEPVQSATSSIYFCLKRFGGASAICPIEVYYIYECSQIIIHPREKSLKVNWLLDIIKQKKKFFKENSFKIEEMI